MFAAQIFITYKHAYINKQSLRASKRVKNDKLNASHMHVCTHACSRLPTHNLLFWPKCPPLELCVAEMSLAEMSGPKRPWPKCLWPKYPSTAACIADLTPDLQVLLS